MSTLLARIMLALLMFPMAAVLFVVLLVLGFDVFGLNAQLLTFFVAGSVTAIFLATYWVLLWRRTVRWKSWRVTGTVAWGLMTGVIGAFVGALGSITDPTMGLFLGGSTWMLLWMFGTVFVWRETAAERLQRFRSANAEAIVCPTCGYNMTGLKQTTCPECGSAFTVNELIAAQPLREQEELVGSGD